MLTFKEEVIGKIKSKLAEMYGIDEASISEDTNFKDDLGVDSAGIVRLTAFLEDEYDVEVPFMAFKRNKTVGEAADFMADLTGFE